MPPAAFQVEYDRVSEFLYRFAVQLTRDASAAEDLVQETAYRALGSCERIAPGTNFKAWISTIMRNTYLSAYRKRKRGPAYVTTATAAEEFGEARPINARPIHARTVNAGTSHLSFREMEARLVELSPAYAEPFGLYYSGYRYEEVAELMKLPVATVKSRILTARKQLKRKIAGGQ